jgi:hypothetical protein
VAALGSRLQSLQVIWEAVGRFTLWEEGLEVLHMCRNSQPVRPEAVKRLWANIVYNELPAAATSERLQRWRDRRAAGVEPRWWAEGRRVGRQKGGVLDARDDEAMKALVGKVTGLARKLVVENGAYAPSPAFPLFYVCSELEAIEAEVDMALGLSTYREVPDPTTLEMPHRFWRELRALGVPYYELFRTYTEVYTSAAQGAEDDLKLHAFDTLRSLTEAWYRALVDDARVPLDSRHQAAVENGLRRLAPLHPPTPAYVPIVNSLNDLRQAFHRWPDRLD